MSRGFEECCAVGPRQPTIASAHRTAEADRARAWLKEAVSASYKDAAHLQKDNDLDSLRTREDFKQLVTELKRVKTSEKQSREMAPAARRNRALLVGSRMSGALSALTTIDSRFNQLGVPRASCRKLNPFPGTPSNHR